VGNTFEAARQVFRSALHANQIAQADKVGLRIADAVFDTVSPMFLESDPRHKGRNVSLQDVLADQNLFRYEIIDGNIGHVIADLNLRTQGALGVLRRGPDSNVYVESGSRIAVNGKGRRANNNVADLMSV
jgi:hypothetical protein